MLNFQPPATSVLGNVRGCLSPQAQIEIFAPFYVWGTALAAQVVGMPPVARKRSRRAIMEEYRESNHNENGWAAGRADANRWLVVAAVALFGIAAVAFAYGYHQQSVARQLTLQAAAASAAVNQMQGQVNALTAKLNEQLASPSPAEPRAAATPPSAEASESASDVS